MLPADETSVAHRVTVSYLLANYALVHVPRASFLLNESMLPQLPWGNDCSA